MFYNNLFSHIKKLFYEDCERDFPAFLSEKERSGSIEILASSATHAVLPLLSSDSARRAQVRTAKRIYRRDIGFVPKGFWLPECAYADGIERIIEDEGFNYFFLDAKSIIYGNPKPEYGTRYPLKVTDKCFVFPRDMNTAKEVWGAKTGYPTHPSYREFYRDLAFDADKEYLAPYLHSDGVRRPLGFKYHKITGVVPLYEKDIWDPDEAIAQAKIHAKQFVDARLREAEEIGKKDNIPILFTAPFDAELFGHWWFEGPWFIEALFREMKNRDYALMPITPREWLDRYEVKYNIKPDSGTWGAGRDFSTWLNPDNAWIYRHLYNAEKTMEEITKRIPMADGVERRALDQALRELLLAQASDWPFIMTKKTVVSYATKRFRNHIYVFRKLIDSIESGRIDESFLKEQELNFPFGKNIDYRDFS